MTDNAALKVYALHCGGDRSTMAVFDPFDPNCGQIAYNPYYMYVITHPRGNVLLDTGAHPSLRTSPRARLGDAADTFDLVLAETDTVPAKLAEIGLKPEDISHVVMSHLHFDHAGGLYALPHAQILVQREELAFARNPPIYQRAIYLPEDFELNLNWQLLDGEHDIFGDGLLKIIPTPGHTKGHQSLLVQLPTRPLFLLADAAYLIAKMRARALPAVLWSPDAIIASWEKIERIEAETNARLVATHELDYETSVPKAPNAYYS
jgi:N-acyl homoserine lactone hydrolase